MTYNRDALDVGQGVLESARGCIVVSYGTDAISGFPVKVPVGAVDPEVLKNSLHRQSVCTDTLRFGWMGLTAFTVALMLAAIAVVSEKHAGALQSWGVSSYWVARYSQSVRGCSQFGCPTTLVSRCCGDGGGSSTPSKRKPRV